MPAWISTSIPIAQMALSVILVALILIQGKGAGLSGVLGGEGNVYRTRRGAEQTIFVTTIIVAILFFGVALANVLI